MMESGPRWGSAILLSSASDAWPVMPARDALLRRVSLLPAQPSVCEGVYEHSLFLPLRVRFFCSARLTFCYFLSSIAQPCPSDGWCRCYCLAVWSRPSIFG